MKTIWNRPVIMLALLFPLAALAQQPTSYDADGDGIADSVDQCAYVKGLKQFNGCPYAKGVTLTDRDGDGVSDVDDACADLFGLKTNNGCPASQGAGTARLFTTQSGTEASETESFRQTIKTLIADSSDIRLIRKDQNTTGSPTCLVGANECYVYGGDGGYYYANYGSYSTMDAANEKIVWLRQQLLQSLGEADWNYTMLDGTNTSRELRVEKKAGAQGKIKFITVHMRKIKEGYNVYLTAK